jgi:hypothetical protein
MDPPVQLPTPLSSAFTSARPPQRRRTGQVQGWRISWARRGSSRQPLRRDCAAADHRVKPRDRAQRACRRVITHQLLGVCHAHGRIFQYSGFWTPLVCVFWAPLVCVFCAPLVQRRQARFLLGKRVVVSVLPASADQGSRDA